MNERHKKEIELRFARLSSNQKYELFFHKVKELKTDLSIEDKEFLVDSFRWADVELLQPEFWIYELIGICNRIMGGEAVLPEFGMFFIRLHGVLTELPDHFLKHVDEYGNIFDDLHEVKIGREISRLIHTQLIDMKSKFDDIEMKSIEYFRNQHAHVFINRYRIQRDHKGIFHRIFGKNGETSRMEQMDLIVKYLSKYNVSDRIFSEAICPRIIDQLNNVRGLLYQREVLTTVIT